MKWNRKIFSWIPVIIFMFIAVSFRWYRTSTEYHYLLSGSDGPYFPLQVRSLFEHGRLAFPDMPLLFIIGAFVAKLFFFLHLGTVNECVLMAVRFIDTVLPPLTAIPVFCIARLLSKDLGQIRLSFYLLVAFSILSFTPLYLFSFQLQKNGLATLFIFSYLYFVIRILAHEGRSNYFKAFIVLLLCALTHFGSFGFLVFISLLLFIIWYWVQDINSRREFFTILSWVVVVFILLFSVIAVFDYSRFLRIFHVPLKLFEAPVLLFALQGQNYVLNGSTLLILLAMNLLTFLGIVVLIWRRKSIDRYKYLLGLAMALSTIFISNPLLGLEWASRLFMLAYIPIIILYFILYGNYFSYWFQGTSLFVFSALLFVSIGTSIFDKSPMTMDYSSFKELQQMRVQNIFQKGDAIVARQSLRILSNWVFEVKGVDKYLLTKDEYSKYHAVFLLRQIKGRNPNARGSEPKLGDSVMVVYKGMHFEVFQLTSNAQLPKNPEKIFKGIRGTIVKVDGKKAIIRDTKSDKLRTIFYDPNNEKFPKLRAGMKVEVNGEWIAFSLDIWADTIKEIDQFDQ